MNWTARLAAAVIATVLVAPPAWAGKATATAGAITLKPLSIIKLSNLDFGTFATSTAAGTIVIAADSGVRSVTGGVAATGGTPRAAQFYTYSTAGSVLSVTRGALPTLTRAGGGATMAVTGLTLNGAVTRVVNATGILDLRVGGTLAVSANQPDGVYSGSFDIIVSYN